MLIPVKKFVFIVLILPFAGPHIVFSQPDIIWESTFGGTLTDRGVDIIATADSGYLALGWPYSQNGAVTSSHGSTDFWLIKLDQNGQLDWEKAYGGSKEDNPEKIIPVNGGGYFLLGSTMSTNGDISASQGGFDAWLVKLDEQGNILWEKTYGGTAGDYGSAITPTADGNFIIAGRSSSSDLDVPNSNNGQEDIWVFKIDPDGEILWSRLYGGSNTDSPASIIPTNDGGCIVAGSSFSADIEGTNNHGLRDVFILKLDGNGDVIWKKMYGSVGHDYNEDMVSSGDGGAMLINTSNSPYPTNHGDFDVWVLKIGESGQTQWHKCYGGSAVESGTGIRRSTNGTYILTGIPNSYDGDLSGNFNGQNAWMFCINPEGTILWKKTYGGSLNDVFTGLKVLSDGEFAVIGHTSSNDGDVTPGVDPANYGDVWILRMSLNVSDANDILSPGARLQITPNPATDAIDITTSEDWQEASLTITSVGGRRMAEQQLGASRRVDLSALPAGMYVVSLVSEKGVRSATLVKQ